MSVHFCQRSQAINNVQYSNMVVSNDSRLSDVLSVLGSSLSQIGKGKIHILGTFSGHSCQSSKGHLGSLPTPSIVQPLN